MLLKTLLYHRLSSAVSTLLTVVLFASVPALAGGGKISDGGGDGDHPSFDEIRQTLHRMAEEYADAEWAFVPRQLVRRSEMFGIQPPGKALQDLLGKISADSWDSENKVSFRPVHLFFEESGACSSSEGDVDASTPLCDREKPICFSLPRLQARYSKANLKENLIPLFMHEIAHQNCADEKMAKEVERFYAQSLITQSKETSSVLWNARMISIHLRDLQTLNEQMSEKSICLSLGSLEIYVQKFSMETASIFRRQGLSISKEINHAYAILNWVGRLGSSYCGDSEEFNLRQRYEVNPGDKKGIVKVISKGADAFNVLANELNRNADFKIPSISASK